MAEPLGEAEREKGEVITAPASLADRRQAGTFRAFFHTVTSGGSNKRGRVTATLKIQVVKFQIAVGNTAPLLLFIFTTMDYEKKYKEALEDMRAIYPNLKGDAKLAAEHAFPELKESDDERIRKWILEYLYDGLRKSDEQFKEQFKTAIAYLEKQKEQKPAEWSEEDEEMLEYIIEDVNDATELYTSRAGKDMADKEIAWLKSLRPSWKPSEEQMNALEKAIIKAHSTDEIPILTELRQQLKKLI